MHCHDYVVLVSVCTLCTVYCVVVFDTPTQARVKSTGQLKALKLIKLEPGIADIMGNNMLHNVQSK